MQILQDYWWVIIIFLVGVLVNHLVDLNKMDHKQYLKHRNKDTDDSSDERKNKKDDIW
ncbi:YpfN family protein [Thorsellia anophelis]|uniref:YpfN family protein n=1 Tax=Thorsellia anophelis DSM 18579 TaxID=1123402 RepID=A0A1I0CI41_9GAMM|nr:YpfN family protein [Thorsellia anophelis]SET19267.1 Uncharacterised protein family (UPF0370) [Thorsellia anophelis DSM 18579]